METGAIVVVIAAVALFVILWRTASGSDDKKVTPPQPSPQPTQPDLESLTKAELLVVADDLGVEVRQSWTKAKIIQVIIIAQREGLN
jgi:hypothetical protein